MPSCNTWLVFGMDSRLRGNDTALVPKFTVIPAKAGIHLIFMNNAGYALFHIHVFAFSPKFPVVLIVLKHLSFLQLMQIQCPFFGEVEFPAKDLFGVHGNEVFLYV